MDIPAPFVKDHFSKHGADYSTSFVLQNTPTPVSTVLINSQTGSRTILHFRGTMRELTFEDFKDKICLADYSWVHFEGGRLPGEILKDIEYIHQYNQEQEATKISVSVELEKAREEMRKWWTSSSELARP